MNPRRLLQTAVPLLALLGLASSTTPLTVGEQFHSGAAVCHGVVRRVESFVEDGGEISTRAWIEVREAFKGVFPPVVLVAHRGGSLGGVSHWNGFAPDLRVDGEHVFFLRRAADRTLFALAGGVSAPRLQRASGPGAGGKPPPLLAPHEALLVELRALSAASLAPGEDVSDQAGLPGTLESSGGGGGITPGIAPPGQSTNNVNGFPARFLAQDRGEPVGYLVDAQFLPSGITLAQGTNAVGSAFAAWGAVTGIRFEFQGLAAFGNAASASTNLNGSPRNDSRIRVQLHDAFGASPGGSVLGIGGRFASFFTNGPVPLNWGTGGNVNGFEFNRSTAGYVVLEHTNTSLSNPLTLAEVLCHEIGHVLNLAHSSETPNEPDTVLSNAMMYFRVHADGRGATLGSYDPPVVRAAYPPTNPPPWTENRVMDVVVSFPAQPDVPGVNSVRLQAFDLLSTGDTPDFSVAMQNESSDFGTFAVNGMDIRYAPAVYGTGPRLDPAGGSFYEIAYARVSDGTNASPWVRVRVISISPDDFPSPSDGIPDAWMIEWFGDPDPSAGLNRGADDDFDGDGFTNFEEYLLGSDPANPGSNIRIFSLLENALTFESRPYENYELLGSTNLAGWSRLPISVLPTVTNAVFTNFIATNAQRMFYRVGRVP